MPGSRISIVVLLLLCFVLLGFNLTEDKEAILVDISHEYKNYKQYRAIQIVVTDSSKYKWTIQLCSRPNKNLDMGWHLKKDSSFVSKADKTLGAHGNKLYRLFIKYYDPYLQRTPAGQPIGQTIVKETWNIQEIVYDSLNTKIQQIENINDGKWYTPTTVSELFIMYKEKENVSNDKGWNYGIISMEDKEQKPILLNNEKISSCIGCHSGTKYDRIFGVR